MIKLKEKAYRKMQNFEGTWVEYHFSEEDFNELLKETAKSFYGYGILHDENNPNVHTQFKRAWELFNKDK